MQLLLLLPLLLLLLLLMFMLSSSVAAAAAVPEQVPDLLPGNNEHQFSGKTDHLTLLFQLLLLLRAEIFFRTFLETKFPKNRFTGFENRMKVGHRKIDLLVTKFLISYPITAFKNCFFHASFDKFICSSRKLPFALFVHLSPHYSMALDSCQII